MEIKSGFYCEFRENGTPVVREYRSNRIFRESEPSFQNFAVLEGHDNDLIIGFGYYFKGKIESYFEGKIESGVAYRMSKIIY